jgi:hypothetical protein
VSARSRFGSQRYIFAAELRSDCFWEQGGGMRKLSAKLFGLLTLLLLFPAQLLAVGDEPVLIVLVADTRKLHGWEAWWANLYNEGHLAFALATIVIIPVCGVILGLLADLVMSRLGIDLKKRALVEH